MIIIDKERVSIDMPQKVENAKIALISEALELKNPEADTKISITDPSQLQNFVDREEQILKGIVNKIKFSGANVLFCQRGIDEVVQYYLAKNNIYACRRIAKSDMENLSKATSGKIISNINELTEKELGHAKIVEEIKKGEEGMTYVKGCENPKALTILIHGGSDHVMDELERALKDGLGDVAASIGLNKTEFDTCLSSEKFKEAVQNEYEGGVSAGVQATPTSFVYDMETGQSVQIAGALPIADVKSIIDKMINQ